MNIVVLLVFLLELIESKCIHDQLQKKVRQPDYDQWGVRQLSQDYEYENKNGQDQKMNYPSDPNYAAFQKHLYKTLSFKPMEIKFHLDKSFQTLSQQEQNVLKDEVFPYIQSYIKKVMQVRSDGFIDLSYKQDDKCLTLEIPDYVKKARDNENITISGNYSGKIYYNDGLLLDGRKLQTDYLILLGVSNDPSGNVMASSIQCRYNLNSLFRPILGEMIIHRPEIVKYIMSDKRGDTEYQFESMLSTILHEVFHLLGFSEDMYKYYLNEEGELRGISNVVEEIQDRGIGGWGLKSKSMMEWARGFFNCPHLQHIPLENEGDGMDAIEYIVDGWNKTSDESSNRHTMYSHFDKRVVHDDIMIADNMVGLGVTPFLMYLMEETGWYKMNFTYIHYPIFGYKEGCGFINNKCVSNTSDGELVSQSVSFCDDIHSVGCAPDYLSFGICGTNYDKKRFNDKLHPEMNYYGNRRIMDQQGVDNCPIYTPFKNSYCLKTYLPDDIIPGYYDTKELELQKYSDIDYLNRISAKSRCVVSSLNHHNRWPIKHAQCFEVDCIEKEGKQHLIIHIDKHLEVECHISFKRIWINEKSWTGYIECPDIERMCISTGWETFTRNKHPYGDV